jgi:hypothetical protein
MRKKQIRLKEMELHTLAGMNEHNSKQLNAMLDTYRKLLFPGMEEDEERESAMAQAQAALAAEAKKVLVVRKLKPGEGLPGKQDKRFAPLAARHAADLEREKMKQKRQLRDRSRRKR